jgi:hypothetical protein
VNRPVERVNRANYQVNERPDREVRQGYREVRRDAQTRDVRKRNKRGDEGEVTVNEARRSRTRVEAAY